LGALIVSAPSEARAGVAFEPSEVRRYMAPDGFDPRAAIITSTRDGTTLLAATTGSEESTRCEVILVNDMAASSFTYLHEEQPTYCLGIESDDEGFFLRGADPTATADEITGFTAYVDSSGNLRWTIDDQEIVDAKDEAEGGTGSFLGVYDKPNPAMTYSAEFGKLLAFTDGKLLIGPSEKGVTQAHVVDVATGRLTVTGQTFGQNAVGIVGGTATRETDGYFLLYLYSAGDRGAFFYSYNGRNRISFFEPLGESWEDRIVTTMVYGPGERLTLLWTPNTNADADTRITSVDDQGMALYNGQWPAEANVGGELVALGRPLGLWVGAEHTMALYGTGVGLHARVIETVSGEELGVVSLDGVTEHAPVAILNGPGDTLKLLAFDSEEGMLFEYLLAFSEVDDPPPVMPDMGAPSDMGQG
ncbi:unnamed protein product, partial [Laminaria digitata]